MKILLCKLSIHPLDLKTNSVFSHKDNPTMLPYFFAFLDMKIWILAFEKLNRNINFH